MHCCFLCLSGTPPLANATFTGLTFWCFGAGCHLYTQLEAVCATLHSPTVRQIKSLLSPLTIKQYHFAVCNAARQFFYHRCKLSEFADGAIPIFPRSALHTLIPFIQNGQAYENVSFPLKWRSGGAAQQQPAWQYQAPPQVGPPQPPTVNPPASFPTNAFDMFALSVLNPKFLAPPQHHSRCIDCLLSHLFSLAFTTSSGVQSRAHLGPVSDLIVVSGRVAEQSARHPSLFLLSGFGLILLSKPTMLPCC